MKKRNIRYPIVLSALFISAALLLCGCDSKPAENDGTTPGEITGVTGELLLSEDTVTVSDFPVTVNDVIIQSSPKKVICLSSSLTEMICELGYGSRLIGRGSYCDYPDSVKQLTDYGKPSSPKLDDIKAVSPDILITATSIPSKDITELSELGITVLYIPSPRSVEEYGRIYCALGMVFEGLFEGEEAGNKVFRGIKSTLTGSGISLGRFIYVTEGGVIAGGDTFEGSVLTLFGENIAADASGYSFDKSLLKENQPDTVILNKDVPESELTSDSILGSLDAVVNGRVITVSNSYFESPSGRLTELLSELNGEKEASGET
ncbi:MAG: ABC transporter substrate-binding protein [Ruminiclostridium sp.]|nr:ABC transporter substrate-binding protein [Ruminiclostridium sp.]